MRRWWPRSLFGRLLLLQAALAAALAVSLPVLISRTLSGIADDLIVQRLTHRADALDRGLAANRRPGSLTILLPEHRTSSHRFGVFDAAGKLILSGHAGFPLRLSELRRGRAPAFSRHGRYDILVRPLNRHGTPTRWIAVATDRTHPEEVVDDIAVAFLRPFFWIVPVSLLVSLGLSLAVMKRMTNTIRRTAAAADRIGIADPEKRIDETYLPIEVLPLVHAVNRAIDRMSAAYEAQKEFASSVAHELRTPLALLSLHTEALPAAPARDRLQADIAQANHVVRQLMDLTMTDRLHPTLEAVDPVAVAREVVESMVPLVYQAGDTIALDAAEAVPWVVGVPALLSIALVNLIENAVRHTPTGTTITVTVERDGSVIVDDDGPGLAREERDHAGRRFRRGDTARSDSAGLGLAIVERIMTACGGALEVEQKKVRGARVRLLLSPMSTAL